jgi:hypothetical protein
MDAWEGRSRSDEDLAKLLNGRGTDREERLLRLVDTMRAEQLHASTVAKEEGENSNFGRWRKPGLLLAAVFIAAGVAAAFLHTSRPLPALWNLQPAATALTASVPSGAEPGHRDERDPAPKIVQPQPPAGVAKPDVAMDRPLGPTPSGDLAAAVPPSVPHPSEPVSAQQPVPAQQPIPARQPVSTQPPVSTEPSVSARQPVSTQPPVSTEPSVAAQQPVSAEPPVSAHPPVSAQQPIPAQPPLSDQQPVSTPPDASQAATPTAPAPTGTTDEVAELETAKPVLSVYYAQGSSHAETTARNLPVWIGSDLASSNAAAQTNVSGDAVIKLSEERNHALARMIGKSLGDAGYKWRIENTSASVGEHRNSIEVWLPR